MYLNLTFLMYYRPTFPIASDIYGGALILYSSPMFYALALILLPSITLLPVFLYFGYVFVFFFFFECVSVFPRDLFCRIRYMLWPDEVALARDEEMQKLHTPSKLLSALTSVVRSRKQNYVVVNST